MSLHNELAQAMHDEVYDVTEEGLFFPKQGVMAAGEYFDRVNNGAWGREPNLIPDEGLSHILAVSLGSTSKPAGYYLALFKGSSSPSANWTGSSFASAADEITSMSEGYTSPTRPKWEPAEAEDGEIDNLESVATVTIATSTELTVTGAAMLSNSTRGGTSGVLISASKYASERVFQDGDKYDIGYRISLKV